MPETYETREFTQEELTELGLPFESDAVILDEVVDHMRWEVVHSLVFFLGGKFYEVSYSVPATENQEYDLWGYGSVTARVVRPKQVTSIQFVPVKARG